MIFVVVLACAGQAPETSTGTTSSTGPADGDTLVVAIPLDPGNVNPLVAPSQLSGWICDLVEPGLVARNVTDQGLVYEPALATSWEWSGDGAVLTYHLRTDAKWGDGQPLTGADVRFTHELIGDPLVASNWFGTARHIAGIDTPDDHTVVYRFDGPRNPILQQGYTIRGVVPEHALKDADRATLRGDESARDPLPSGPFRVAAWTPNDKVVLEPNPNAPADWKPHLARILFRIMPEYQNRLGDVKIGAVDLLPDVQPEDVAALEADPRLTVVRKPADSMEYLGYNLTLPMFQDVRVRTALTLGVDRDKLLADLYSGADGTVYGQACIGDVAPTLGPWYASEVKPLPFDPERAKALLDEAGWKDDGDGVRSKDGKDLRFRVMLESSDPKAGRTAVLVQAAWKAIGVQLDVEAVDGPRFADRARQKDYEAMLWGFAANPKVDLSQEWRSDGPYNWFGYSNPDVDALIDQGVAATDLTTSQAAFREVQAKVYADQPVTFLFWTDGFEAIDKRFRDVQTNTFTPLFHAERWWVPEDEQKYRR